MSSILSRRKAAVAGFTAAVAFAVPVASAHAATTATTPLVDPQVCQLLNVSMGLAPGLGGGSSLAAVLAHAGATVNCPAPGGQPTSPFPGLPPITFPWLG